MKFLIINGSPRQNGNTAELLKPFSARLKENGAFVEQISLADKKILPCTGCHHCQNVQGEYGCVQKDDVAAIVEKITSADCIVLATPIYTWYCTSQMKALLDRHYGMNKYYGTATGSLWSGKSLALLTTHGYKADYANDPFEEGVKRLCVHSKLKYLGLYSVRDTQDIKSFQTAEAISGAVAFADRLMNMEAAEAIYRKEVILDGNLFHDIQGFYREMVKLFISDKRCDVKESSETISQSFFSAEEGPEALGELLDSAFQQKGEPILLRWSSFSKSCRDLGEPFVNRAIKIIEDEKNKGHDCIVNTKD